MIKKGGDNMKRSIALLIIITLFIPTVAFAKGGMGPCLATCCLGPRVGLEMNEDTDIRGDEWNGLLWSLLLGINTNLYMSTYKAGIGKSMNDEKERERLGGPMIEAKAPKHEGGCGPMFGSFCLAPRIGLEMNDGRKIRTREYLYAIPLVNLFPLALECQEALSGKTMSEIAEAEDLDS
jgi:hypothetical protein